MIIERQEYLDRLIAGQGNGLVKIVTGGRRCGKSFLLFKLFHDYLESVGVDGEHLTELSLDDRRNRRFTEPDLLLEYLDSRLRHDGKTNYVILDEVQMVDDFVGVLLSLMHTANTEVYVSGSNSRFLSKDVVTEFRGRGQEIRVWPLSFAEFYGAVGGDRALAWNDYYAYGGLPQVLRFGTGREKRDYLREIYEFTYLKDVIDRNKVRNPGGMKQLVRVLASSIGSSTNPRRIGNTFLSSGDATLSDKTIREYISFLQDSFLLEEALRYDVKGRKYIGTETKYYFTDLGLRNIALNYRQQEETHIMENVIYNELRRRGYLVDVGKVESWSADPEGNKVRHSLEVDFVVNSGAERVYLQAAYHIPTAEKEAQELRPLLLIGDNFRKIVVVRDDIKRKMDERGVVTMSLFDFLLDRDSLEKF